MHALPLGFGEPGLPAAESRTTEAQRHGEIQGAMQSRQRRVSMLPE